MKNRIVKNLEKQENKIVEITQKEVTALELRDELCALEHNFIMKTNFKELNINTKSGKISHLKSVNPEYKNMCKKLTLLELEIERCKEDLSLLKKQYHFYMKLL